MGLETGTYINDLVTTNPDGAVDPKSAGDDHLRLIKSTLKATFPGMAGAVWRHQAKSGDYPLAATDAMTILTCTGTITITTTAAAAISGFMCLVKNAGTGIVTIGGIGYPPGSFVMIRSNGSAVSTETLSGPVFLARGSAAATDVTITGLSTTAFSAYKLIGRNITTLSSASVQLRVGNGSIDSGANYSIAFKVHTSGNADASSGANGVTQMSLCGASTAVANFEATIFNIAATDGVQVLHHGSYKAGTNDYRVLVGSSFWYGGTSGIDRIQIIGSTAPLVGGTFHLYGIP